MTERAGPAVAGVRSVRAGADLVLTTGARQPPARAARAARRGAALAGVPPPRRGVRRARARPQARARTARAAPVRRDYADGDRAGHERPRRHRRQRDLPADRRRAAAAARARGDRARRRGRRDVGRTWRPRAARGDRGGRARRDLRRAAGAGRRDGLRARRPLAGDAAGVPRARPRSTTSSRRRSCRASSRRSSCAATGWRGTSRRWPATARSCALRHPIDTKRLCPPARSASGRGGGAARQLRVAGRRRSCSWRRGARPGVECVTVGATARRRPTRERDRHRRHRGRRRRARSSTRWRAAARPTCSMSPAATAGSPRSVTPRWRPTTSRARRRDWLDRDRLAADLAGYAATMGQVNREPCSRTTTPDARARARRAVPPALAAGGSGDRAAARARPARALAVGAEQDAIALRQAADGARGRWRRSTRAAWGGARAPAGADRDAAGSGRPEPTPPAGAVSGLVASERAPGLLAAPGVELPDDVVLGATS